MAKTLMQKLKEDVQKFDRMIAPGDLAEEILNHVFMGWLEPYGGAADAVVKLFELRAEKENVTFDYVFNLACDWSGEGDLTEAVPEDEAAMEMVNLHGAQAAAIIRDIMREGFNGWDRTIPPTLAVRDAFGDATELEARAEHIFNAACEYERLEEEEG